jgi:hypothetical protein
MKPQFPYGTSQPIVLALNIRWPSGLILPPAGLNTFMHLSDLTISGLSTTAVATLLQSKAYTQLMTESGLVPVPVPTVLGILARVGFELFPVDTLEEERNPGCLVQLLQLMCQQGVPVFEIRVEFF